MSDWIFTFDLETTGTNTNTDRIVQIAGELLNLRTGEHESRVRMVNPEMPIPPEATEVHGITNQDVALHPTFARVARSLVKWIGDAHFVGYNVRRFDLRILLRQLRECGVELDMEERLVVDVMQLYFHLNPRSLLDAVRQYMGDETAKIFEEKAHDALWDVFATRDLFTVLREEHFKGQDLFTLHKLCDDQFGILELTPWDEWFKGSDPPRFQFGKCEGKLLHEAPSDYVEWMLKKVGDSDFTQKVEEALIRARFPDGEPHPGRAPGPAPPDQQSLFSG